MLDFLISKKFLKKVQKGDKPGWSSIDTWCFRPIRYYCFVIDVWTDLTGFMNIRFRENSSLSMNISTLDPVSINIS